jgi:hypothetical protein
VSAQRTMQGVGRFHKWTGTIQTGGASHCSGVVAPCMRDPHRFVLATATRHTWPENFTLPCQQAGPFLFSRPNVGLDIRDLRGSLGSGV